MSGYEPRSPLVKLSIGEQQTSLSDVIYNKHANDPVFPFTIELGIERGRTHNI